MTRDVALGGILLALAGAYYTMAAAIPASQLDDAVGPQGLPKAYAVLLGVLSVLLIVRGLRAVPFASGGPRSGPSPRVLGRVAGMLAIGVVYIVVVPWAGYLVSVAVLIVGTAYYQGGVLNRHVLVIGAAGATLLWLVFVKLLGIPQPEGIWSTPW